MCIPAANQRVLKLILVFALVGGAVAAEYIYPLGGATPWERPEGAPVTNQYEKGAAWYTQALQGISQPYPPSLRFLEDQGAWHTPFNRPGMPPPYDIRGWHSN